MLRLYTESDREAGIFSLWAYKKAGALGGRIRGYGQA
jgi:hypothetical protein